MARAPIIDELEDLYQDGKCDREICEKAIEIIEWLIEEGEIVKNTLNISRAIEYVAQKEHFIKVIDKIRAGRHANALDDFEQHCISQGYIT